MAAHAAVRGAIGHNGVGVLEAAAGPLAGSLGTELTIELTRERQAYGQVN
jgi:hypothetical protein